MASLHRAGSVIVSVLCIAGMAGLAGAQGVTVSGTVIVAGSPVRVPVRAELEIPALQRTVRTDDAGRYRFSDVPAGRYSMEVRAIGFVARTERLTVNAGTALVRDIALSWTTQMLDTAVTRGQRSEYISPALRGFEERRKLGIGRFIGEAELRKNDSKDLPTVIRRLPGVYFRTNGMQFYLASMRRTGGATRALSGGDTSRCFASVYRDGVLVYDQVMTPNAATHPPPDLKEFSINTLAGVEYYAGESTVPAGVRGSPCGVLMLWTREK